MTTLNKLPDGSPAPRYRCTGAGYINGEYVEVTAILTEWWYEGVQIQTIEQSAEEYFYDSEEFNKAPCDTITIEAGEI